MTSDRDAFFKSRDEVATTGPYWKTERMSNTPSPSPAELQRMREKSGSITDNRPLVTFLYRLMRDELPPGKIEQLLLESGIDEPVTTPHEVLFTNGWLANIAQDIAFRLTGWDAQWPTEDNGQG